jgi:hypothetical protein
MKPCIALEQIRWISHDDQLWNRSGGSALNRTDGLALMTSSGTDQMDQLWNRSDGSAMEQIRWISHGTDQMDQP